MFAARSGHPTSAVFGMTFLAMPALPILSVPILLRLWAAFDRTVRTSLGGFVASE
jgi:hypothetical protein